MSTFQPPMLLETTPSPISSSEYIAEPKIDGIRGVFVFESNRAQLWSRHQTNFTKQYPELCKKPVSGESVILDGEVAMYNPSIADFDFDGVMDRFRLRNELKIKFAAERNPAVFIVWDVLFHNGRDLRMLPLHKRKTILNEILCEHDSLSKVASLPGEQGVALANQIVERGWEGCVYKKIDSPYLIGKRSSTWMKWLNNKTSQAYITGIRKKKFGWMLSIMQNGTLLPAGILELGTSEGARKKVWQHAKGRIINEDSNFYYLEPDPALMITAKYARVTRNGYMRTPSFKEFVQAN
ncbi:ATP-dependent DNA ligase [Paenibacillus sp. Y412MC10]|uniref:ATP-dependent DNA ligase n=1 Tax=Geobacillus sp. (strain Y412MC10) TaxID=481743 RepID=UPI0011AB7E2D|nr:ATP-dependent DNA ligase [Paenibacillus sp. Y412MC10]